jgi:superkiller protein 3
VKLSQLLVPIMVVLGVSLVAGPSSALTADERVQILEKRAQAQIDSEKWDDALATGRQAVRIAPQSAEAWALLGLTRAMHPEMSLAEAERAASRGRDLDPLSAKPHYVFALMKWWRGDLQGAEAKCREALYLDSEYAEVHEVLGMVLSDQGRGEEGIAELREAVRLNPDGFDPHFNLAWTLYWHGHVEEALREHEVALARAWTQPDRAYAHNNAAYFCAALGRGAEAIQEAKMASKLRPNDPYVADTLGHMTVLFGDVAEAESILRDALSLEAPRLASLSALAYALALQGKEEAAREELARFSRAMIYADVNVDALYFVGKAYAELGMDIAAARAFRRAVDKWPDHPWSEEIRTYLAEHGGG